MLAKSLKRSGRGPLLINLVKPVYMMTDGETALVKRTQGIMQTAGRLATSSRLLELRKQVSSGSRPSNVMGKTATNPTDMAREIGVPPEYEIVVCIKRSE